MKFHLTPISRNRKTGPIPVATASSDTCPPTCALLNQGCYAQNGPTRLHWLHTDRFGVSFSEFLKQVRALPRNQLWRYGQAGDLPKSPKQVRELAKANGRRPVLAYTHTRNFKLLKEIQQVGFNVNLSADNLLEADELVKTGLPVVTVLPSSFEMMKGESLQDYRKRLGGSLSLRTPAGNKVAICPATYTDTTCQKCQVCSRPDRHGVIIGFPAHGSRKRQIDAAQKGVQWKSVTSPSPS